MPSGQERTMPGLTVSGSPRIGAIVRQSFTAMTPAERTRVTALYGAIAGLHLLGFFILFVFVVPSHYKGLGTGVAILAYTLGLRHAFDADHISAIDNTTRKVLGERQGTGKPRPFGFGFYFSLGHSSVVVAIGVAIIAAERPVFPALSNSGKDGHFRGDDRLSRGIEQRLAPRAFRGLLRHDRVRVVPVPDRAAEPSDPGRDRTGLHRDAPRTVRRGRAGAPAGGPRVLLPVLRPLDEGHQQGVAAVPGRGAVRGGLRHRDRD